jgi:glycerol transport system permease protein
MNKVQNNKAWWLVMPVFLLVAFSAVIPMMTVVNYSVQDIFDQSSRYFVGADWYRQVLQDPRLHDSLLRQFIFSGCVLLIEIPLGIAIALTMPSKGRWSSACLIVMAIPLLIPWNVVGTIWQIFGRADIGLLGAVLNNLGISYNYASNTLDAWVTVLVMDVWHWTSLVALLCYSGLRAIPDVYYQAARIDRLRFMDSFMIYTEPFVLTGGGPGNATTFLSQTLTQMAIGQFDLGPAAAFSLVYFLIILLVSWLFYTAMTRNDNLS